MKTAVSLSRAAILATFSLTSALICLTANGAETAQPPLLDNPAPVSEPVMPAQAYYRWLDGNGHIQYTDFEPVGVPSELIPLSPDPSAADAPILSSAGEDWQPDPFNDQDQQILPIEHIGPCADARRRLSVLHAAMPVYQDRDGAYRNAWRGDSYRGERHYLDAEARTRAIVDARAAVLEQCSDPDAFAREVEAFRKEIGGS